MTVVESALCPLHKQSSLQPACRHRSHFYYSTDGQRKRAHVEVTCVYGLSASDEFYLWGLLALSFEQEDPKPVLHATPHYCLRQLGVLDGKIKPGGKTYRDFRDALKRLAGVTYWCDAFYDPLRGERRERIFHFLSFDRPVDPHSSRAWRIVWDGLFFEYVASAGGQFAFDLGTYRELDPATRRLFLLLRKVFHRRRSIRLRVRELAVDQLGYASGRPVKKLKASVKRCINELLNRNILALGKAPDIDALFCMSGKDQWVTLYRGTYFAKKTNATAQRSVDESPLHEPLCSIGFSDHEIGGLLKRFSVSLLGQWADITLAAQEQRGASFFKKSPQAYFRDNVNAAAAGRRTPPDWWHDLRREEERRSWEKRARPIQTKSAVRSPEQERQAFSDYLQGAGQARFKESMEHALALCAGAGPVSVDVRQLAEQQVTDRLWREFQEGRARPPGA